MTDKEFGRNFGGLRGFHLSPAEIRLLRRQGYDFERGRQAGERLQQELDRMILDEIKEAARRRGEMKP